MQSFNSHKQQFTVHTWFTVHTCHRHRHYVRPGGGGGFCPPGLWTFITFLISKIKPLNLVTFHKIYLGTICCSKSLSIKFDITMATTFWQKSLLFWRKFYIFRSFPCQFIDFDHFLINFSSFWRFLENLGNPRWWIQDGHRLRTKRYCDIMWHHQPRLWTSMETFLDVLSVL